MIALFITLLFQVVNCLDKAKYRNDTMDFFQCLACAKEEEGRIEYLKCSQRQPEKVIEASAGCMREVLPAVTSIAQLWPRICKDKEVAGKMYDCFFTKKRKLKLTKEETYMVKDFVICLVSVNKTYCYRKENIVQC